MIGSPGAPSRPGWENKAQVALGVLAVPILAVVLLAVSVPGGHYGLGLVGFVLCVFVMGPAWTLLLLVAALRARRGWSRAVVARWLAVPLVFALVFMAGLTDLPMRVRFEASRADFDRAVESGDAEPGWIGLYEVTSILVRHDGTTTFSLSGGFGSSCGFVHSETTLRRGSMDWAWELGDGWYAVCSGWD